MKKYQICSLCGTKIMTRKGQKYRKIKMKNWTLCIPCYRDYQSSQQVFHEMTKEKKFKIEYLDVGSMQSYTGITFLKEPAYQSIPTHFISKPLRDGVLDKCVQDVGMAIGKSVVSGALGVEWNKAVLETLQQMWESSLRTSSSKEFNNGTNKE